MPKSHMVRNARALRLTMTPAELKLWDHLRLRRLNGFRFRRQMPIGPYIVDFICLSAKLIIEVDGGIHAVTEDVQRTALLNKRGFSVLRFWNHEVLNSISSVKNSILTALSSLPHRRGGGPAKPGRGTTRPPTP